MKIKMNCNGEEHEAYVIDGVIHSECGICDGELLSDVEVVE